MKTKYYGVIAFAFMALCVAVVLTDALNHGRKDGRNVGRHLSVPFSSSGLSVPGTAAIRQMERLTPALPGLASPQGLDTSPVDLGLFGYRNNGGAETGRAWDSSKRPGLDYTVSFAFSGGDKAFCVIDDAFYQQGALLPDGASVAAVDPRGVLVQKDGFERWLPVSRGTKTDHSKGKDEKK